MSSVSHPPGSTVTSKQVFFAFSPKGEPDGSQSRQTTAHGWRRLPQWVLGVRCPVHLTRSGTPLLLDRWHAVQSSPH